MPPPYRLRASCFNDNVCCHSQWRSYLYRHLPTLLVGGYALTGAWRSGVDELVRHLDDAVKPWIYVEYDWYADAYLTMPA
ncbi:MAG: hypothetical protein WED04_03915 [Promethearchaeati archaeon SRVP18_Atabeyarchaeia-1]